MSDEVRTTNAVTGGQKGTKIERFDLIPAEPLRIVAELYGRGAQKYAERNWELGYDWSKSYAALQRHVNAFWRGEDLIPNDPDDPTSGIPHLAAAVFHCLAMMEWATTHPELDDRVEKSRNHDFFGRKLTEKEWLPTLNMTWSQKFDFARKRGWIE